jgi:hypothetical protein
VLRHVVRLAAATFAVAAAGVVVPAPVEASTCGAGSGVSVVVDFHQLGGGVQTFCDAGGAGENAAQQFSDAGHVLTYVQGQPFVCQVDSKPDTQCQRTPPADAYWSLWWSDGKSGEWKYSSVGVTGLKVPDGGSVALSWQGQSSQAKPRVAPPASSAGSPPSSASPHPSTSPQPSTGPSRPSSSAPGSTTSPSGAPSTAPQKAGGHGHGKKHRAHPSQAGKARGKSAHGQDDNSRADGPAGQVTDNLGDAGSGSGGLPGWVAPLAIGILFVGAGTIALVRRKAGGGA